MPASGPAPRDTDAAVMPAVVDPATMRPVAIRGFNVAGELADLVTSQAGNAAHGRKVFGTTVVVADATAVQVVPANPSRISFTVYNNGPTTAWFGNTSGYNDGNGDPLAPGGYLYDQVSNDAWFAFSRGQNGDLRWFEVVPA